jgi:hypothetical protein
MTRRLQLALLAGCALVASLEAPHALATLAEDWRGPYPELDRSLADARAAELPRLALVFALAAHVPG